MASSRFLLQRESKGLPIGPSMVMVLLACVGACLANLPAAMAQTSGGDGYTEIASFDGTRLVNADTYRNGLNTDKNFAKPCSEFDNRKGDFVLRITMGSFVDYIIPASNSTTVCDILTSTSGEGKYRWSSTDPIAEDWNGYSVPVGLASDEGRALGGAPKNFLREATTKGDQNRATISFSGFDDEDTVPSSQGDGGSQGVLLGKRGGCCAHSPHDTSAWYRAFRISLSPVMDAKKLYLVWASEPTAVVPGTPVIFMAKVWNFRGEPYMANPSFQVNLNGTKTVSETSSNSRATLVFEYDLTSAEFGNPTTGDKFALSVTVDAVPNLDAPRNSISLTVPVMEPYLVTDNNLKPCRTSRGVGEMLHFGPADFAIAPVSRFSAFADEWFAAASQGASGAVGEAFLRPIEGHTSTAEADPALAPVTQTWTKVISTDADEGAFSGRYSLNSPTPDSNANGALQFYAFTLYSASTQEVVFQLTASEAYALFIDHAEVEPPLGSSKKFTGANGALTQRTTFSFVLRKGYHQVLVKLFTSQVPENNQVYSELNFKVFGTGVAYTLEAPLEIPKDAYEMSNKYMFYMLGVGENTDAVLYANSIDQDLIGIHASRPTLGATMVKSDQLETGTGTDSSLDLNARRTWTTNVYQGGNIPVDGSDIPANRNYAVKYVAFALYNAYDNDVSVDWRLLVRGHTEMYVDGVLQYSAGEGTMEEAEFATALTPGWHQVIVRVATPRDTKWIFRFYLAFQHYRLFGSLSVPQTQKLPFGLRVINDGVPLQAMLQLTAKGRSITKEKLAAMIAYDPSSETESDITYLPPGISLMRSGVDSGKYSTFYAYGTAKLTLSTASGSTQELETEWVPTTQLQDGVWGSVDEDLMAGGYYRLWAFSVYAAERTTLKADINFVGGYAIWVDGQLRKSTAVTDETKGHLREEIVAMEVSAGWHQVLLKLQVPSTFQLGKTREDLGTGWEDWTEVTNVCKVRYADSFSMCPMEAYCPFGNPRLGADLPLTPKNVENSANVYAPIRNAENTFVQLAGPVDGAEKQPQAICSSTTISVVGDNTLFDYGAGKWIGCCEAIRKPSLSIRFRVDSGVEGKVGYTYHELISVATPKITRSPAYYGRQTITLVSETEEADVRYRLGDNATWKEYTGPFQITKATTISVQAYLASSASGIFTMTLDVPEIITFDRTECLYGMPCPLTFTGPGAGDSASLVLLAQPSKTVQTYAFIEYASSQPQTSLFSGVKELDDSLIANLRVNAPTDSSVDKEQYVVFVYDANNGTQEGYVTMRRALNLIPRTVAADAGALFMTDTYLRDTDTVVFPQLHTDLYERTAENTGFNEDECSTNLCKSAIRGYGATTGAPVTSARTFQSDLSQTKRTSLTCMCVCVGCRNRLDAGPMSPTFAVKRGRIAALPIHVKVVGVDSSNGNDSDSSHENGHTNKPLEKDVGGLVMIILIPIFIIIVVGAVGVFVWFRVRRSRAQARHRVTGTTTVVEFSDQNSGDGSCAAAADFRGPRGTTAPFDDDGLKGGHPISPMGARASTGTADASTTQMSGVPMDSMLGEKSALSYPNSPLTRN